METISRKSTFSETVSENSFKAYDGTLEYRLIKIIGKGTYSNVYFCEYINDDDKQPQVEEDDDDVVSCISDFDITCDEAKVPEVSTKGESMYHNFSALKTIQKPNLHKGQDYEKHKAIFMNESIVL
jgi:Mg2+ and Co2+ transporter CorA